ncbi:hypothetical protein LTR17_008030 [Elasticomyces elasticus]|nr:hypothetical protein LTR17_008030 [Elasticomyces elasticus]
MLRPLGRSFPRPTVRFSRPYNGTTNGPHTTYFQPPPQPSGPSRSIWRSILLGSTCVGIGAYAHSWLYDLPFLGIGDGEEMVDGDMQRVEADILGAALAEASRCLSARNTPVMDLEMCEMVLQPASGYAVTATAISHFTQLASNIPCEDTFSSGAYTYEKDPAKAWCEWGLFDGHAGSRTAELLSQILAGAVGEKLWDEGCFDRPYKPNDTFIIDALKTAFKKVDDDIVKHAMELVRSGQPDRATVVANIAMALSGSCALFALYDPVRHVLRVANTGDSRAVLGRWDGQKYIAHAMSVDQTGFNEQEVERLKRDHPEEDVVDPKTGRVHGIAVSRAFGDARWKWPQEFSKRAHELFWGPSPRPDRMIKTPPYLTAEPEVMETVVEVGERPDFLIMATDGLWDNMSSDDAVACVQLWLDKNKPTTFLEQSQQSPEVMPPPGLGQEPPGQQPPGWQQPKVFPPWLASSFTPSYSTPAEVSGEDEDVYYDKDERCLKWKVGPKHFINEDAHCGIHLVKNALGGKRRDLFTGIMSVQPPLSRNVRDDITVHVVFFGVDGQQATKH